MCKRCWRTRKRTINSWHIYWLTNSRLVASCPPTTETRTWKLTHSPEFAVAAIPELIKQIGFIPLSPQLETLSGSMEYPSWEKQQVQLDTHSYSLCDPFDHIEKFGHLDANKGRLNGSSFTISAPRIIISISWGHGRSQWDNSDDFFDVSCFFRCWWNQLHPILTTIESIVSVFFGRRRAVHEGRKSGDRCVWSLAQVGGTGFPIVEDLFSLGANKWWGVLTKVVTYTTKRTLHKTLNQVGIEEENYEGIGA